MESLFTLEALPAILALTGMEIVLGIDNLIFITILVAKVPPERRARVRRLGIGLALITRLGLLFFITTIMGMTRPWFSAFGYEITGRDAILILGGAFLVGKATIEIHEKLEGGGEMPLEETVRTVARGYAGIVMQIILLDIIFSLDSVITAVGMVQSIAIMVVAMVISVLVMLFSAGAVGDFVERHPTVKILALSFLLLIGGVLIAEGLGGHVAKGMIYFAMAFSFFIEILNIRYRKRARAVELVEPKRAPETRS